MFAIIRSNGYASAMLVVKKSEHVVRWDGFKPSVYNLSADTKDGGLVVVNSMSGGRVLIGRNDRDEALRLLNSDRIEMNDANRTAISALMKAGIIVAEKDNERRQLRHLQAHRTSSQKELQLIVFPTEKCNFRCIYCYEDFVKGRMSPAIRSALRKFAIDQSRSLNRLIIDWFGGEPLLAMDVIEDVLPDIDRACTENSCELSGHITTNGSLLTPSTAEKLLGWKVNSFQITVDGPREEHNKRRLIYRPRHNGNEPNGEPQGTFDQIMENVRALLAQRRIFHLCLRTNYDLDSLGTMEGWIEELADMVKDDPRVRLDFCPIWADPDRVDVSLPMGEERQRTYAELMSLANSKGLRTNASDYIRLGGLVCYAAKANSLVVRSNGDLNKCTVALDADYNHVGKLCENGTVEIDIDKFSKWTSSGMEEDSTCQSCALSAACQGNACPLERFENNRRPCPAPKNQKELLLNLAVCHK